MAFDYVQLSILLLCVTPMIVSATKSRYAPQRFRTWTIYLALAGSLAVTTIGAIRAVIEGRYWSLFSWIAIVVLAVACLRFITIARAPLPSDLEAREAAEAVRAARITLHLRIMLAAGAVALLLVVAGMILPPLLG